MRFQATLQSGIRFLLPIFTLVLCGAFLFPFSPSALASTSSNLVSSSGFTASSHESSEIFYYPECYHSKTFAHRFFKGIHGVIEGHKLTKAHNSSPVHFDTTFTVHFLSYDYVERNIYFYLFANHSLCRNHYHHVSLFAVNTNCTHHTHSFHSKHGATFGLDFHANHC